MYDASGAMEQKINFVNNVRDGEFIDYFGNGNLYERSFYSEGKADGLSVVYYRNGQILREGYFKADKPIGAWKAFYPNGQLSSEVYYGADEQLNGCRTYYTYDGKKVTKKFMKTVIPPNTASSTPTVTFRIAAGSKTVTGYCTSNIPTGKPASKCR